MKIGAKRNAMFCGPRRKSPRYSMMDGGAIVRGDEEHRMQVALFKWAQAATCTRPELGLMFAVPNGGLRDIVTARKLKDEGVKRGVPDVILPVARGGFHGLFIENKSKGRKPRDDQRKWAEKLQQQGYMAVCCDDLMLAIKTITDYLEMGQK